MRRLFCYGLLSLTLFITCCNDNEAGKKKYLDTRSTWFDYQVSGQEGYDSVTVKLQYRLFENGPTFALKEPAKAELDGEELIAYKAPVTGPYYELRKPVAAFTGSHIIRFTGSDGRQYEEKFNFQPIFLDSEIPATISRGPIIFRLQGLKPGGYVRILMTDTVFTSRGVNRVDKVTDGQIIISESDLKGLANGPVQFELIREMEREVKNGTPEGGRITVSYGLRREFILKD